MGDEIYESLMDICETLQTLKEQIQILAYSFIPEDEDISEDEDWNLPTDELRNEEEG